jgi:ABC-type multidrug transport system ATPase subunit
MRYRETTAVDGLSLDVRTGAITALLGPNEDDHGGNL